MKSIRVLKVMVLALCLSASSVTAEEQKDFKFSVAFNPVTALFPWAEIQLGFGFHPNFRLNITPQVITWGWGSARFDGALFGGTLSGSFFFDEWGGWYLEPGLLFLKGVPGDVYWAGAQWIGGYEHVFDSGFFVNLGAGVMVGYFHDGSDEDEWFDFDGVYPLPTGNLLIGFKF